MFLKVILRKKRSVDLKSSLTLISTKQIVKLGDFCMKWVRLLESFAPDKLYGTHNYTDVRLCLAKVDPRPRPLLAFVGASLTDTQSRSREGNTNALASPKEQKLVVGRLVFHYKIDRKRAIWSMHLPYSFFSLGF